MEAHALYQKYLLLVEPEYMIQNVHVSQRAGIGVHVHSLGAKLSDHRDLSGSSRRSGHDRNGKGHDQGGQFRRIGWRGADLCVTRVPS